MSIEQMHLSVFNLFVSSVCKCLIQKLCIRFVIQLHSLYFRFLSGYSITMQCQTTECTQAPILSVTLSMTLFMMFFHDAMCICHSVTLFVTPFVTLTESLSVSFFHNTIYIRHFVSLSTSQRYRNIRNSVRRIYSLHSVTVYDCKSSRDNVRSCNVRIH